MADTTDQGQTALIIAVSEAEEAVREWRLRYDPSAAEGVPAHITVLFPFLPPARIDTPVLVALRRLFAACPPIPFTSARVGRFE